MVSMATMGKPKSGLFWCGWSGEGVNCRGDTTSASKDLTPPSARSTTVAILPSRGGGGSDVFKRKRGAIFPVFSQLLLRIISLSDEEINTIYTHQILVLLHS